MRKISVLILICICSCFGLEYSLRMKALGTDFAYLIPDYETDIYLNPNLIGKKLSSVSYEPGLANPLTFRILTKRFGWCGQYWGSYRNNKLRIAAPINVTSIFIKDLWLLDLRGKLPKFFASGVWNVSNDGSYDERRILYTENWFDTTRTFKYILRVNGSHQIGARWSVVDRLCGGVYHYYMHDEEQTIDQWLAVYSGKIGVFYRDTVTSNKFTSFYIQVGGPTSTGDIDNLPYSIFTSVSDTGDFRHTFFAEAFTTEIGYAKSFPIDERSFFAVGVHDEFSFQQIEIADTNITLRASDNRLSLPMALEYTVGRVSFRFGADLSYSLYNRREWESDSTLAFTNSHEFRFAYTFGLAAKPNEHFIIDLYNVNNLAEINDWSIYLKYLP